MKPNHKVCGFCRHFKKIAGCEFNIENVLDCDLICEKYEDVFIEEMMKL